jgi:DNA-binding CsgD family transcriptional regulator
MGCGPLVGGPHPLRGQPIAMGYWNKAARAREGDPLTPRELEILPLLAAGNTTPDIAGRLGVAPGTVKSHLTSVYKKLGAKNRIEATRQYLDRYAGDPSESPPAVVDRPGRAGEASPLIRRQIRELEVRLEQLAPATSEAERLQHALDALRAIEPH